MAEEQQKMVGARAKIARAQQLKSQGFYIQQEKNSKKKTSRAIVIAVFYAVAVCYAFLVMDAIESKFPLLMQMIRLTGDAGIDRILVIISIASTALMLSGIIPGIAYVWGKMTDDPDASPYVTVWGVGIFFVLISYFAPTIWSGISAVMGVF
jgi:sterol desaturase/sphingolipid hydroxylase (fatty acid hydroxylase superfamily)